MLSIVIIAVLVQIFTVTLSAAMFKLCERISSEKKGETESFMLFGRKG